MVKDRINCFWLLWQLASVALSLALANAGKSIAAKMAIMAMTTSNSIKVNALRRPGSEDCNRLGLCGMNMMVMLTGFPILASGFMLFAIHSFVRDQATL